MNEYTLDTLFIGMEEQFEVTITQEMLSMFTAITGDTNPIHVEDGYALEHGFHGKLVYGMCTAAFFSTLVGIYLPGKYSLFHECNVSFTKPVYIGDRLTITGVVKEIDQVFHRVVLKAFIRNQNGDKVSRAKLVAGIIERKKE